MDSLVNKIAKQAAQLPPESGDFPRCPWADQIPRFFNGEAGFEQDGYFIRKHLESCEECSTLFFALAAQNPPKISFTWLTKGIHNFLEQEISLMQKNAVSAPVLRSQNAAYHLIEHSIPLPTGEVLTIQVVRQREAQIATVSLTNGRAGSFDLLNASDELLKSVDAAKQFIFEVGHQDFSLVVDGKHILRFKGEEV